MQVLYNSCCGIDVHARTVVVCLIKDAKREIRTFSTMTDDLLALLDWLTSEGCTHAAIESTGVYWKPVFNILETSLEVILVNARHVKAVPSRKTDVRDCEWLADLLRHGLLKASFIPLERFENCLSLRAIGRVSSESRPRLLIGYRNLWKAAT